MLRAGVSVAAALVLLQASAAGQETRPKTRTVRIEDVVPDLRLKAKVVRDPSGRLRTSDLELLPRNARDTVLGPVGSVDEDRFEVYGVRIQTTSDTEGPDRETFDPFSLNEEDWVKVDGILREGSRLRARRVRPEEPRERGTIEGRVEAIAPAPDGWSVRVLGVELLVPARTKIEVPPELADLPLQSLLDEPPSRRRRTEEDFIPGSIRFGDAFTLGGTVTARVDREEEFDLDATDDRDRTRPTLRIRLEATARPSERTFLVAGVEQERSWSIEEESTDNRTRRTILKETFLFVRDLPARGFDLEAGRLHFKDDRQWIYDRDLDGIRLTYGASPWTAEASLTTVVYGGRSEFDEETTNAIGVLAREFPGSNEASAFYVGRFHRGAEQGDTQWGGAQFRLRPAGGVRAWLDGALAWGREEGVRVHGYGADAGATLELQLPLEPAVTLGYALGSGGDVDPSDGDSNFRQTGFQDNSGKWSGVTTFALYGELLDPELSNLEIATAGLGLRPGRRTSLDLVAHRYRQPRPAPFLRDAELDMDPDGAHADIGWEVDAILGWREVRNLDVEVVVGRFEPGDAFPATRSATFAKLEVRFKF